MNSNSRDLDGVGTLFARGPRTRLQADFLAGVQMRLPPAEFDLVKASDEQRASLFLPPRPDPEREPKAYELWLHALSRPLKWPTLKPGEPFLSLFGSSRVHSTLRKGGQHSSNWAGAVVRSIGLDHVSRIQAIWTVPEPKPAGSSKGPIYTCSTWVGLDGHDPASRSMPQIGTGQWYDKTSKTPVKLVVWWQWFVRDAQSNGQIPIDLPIDIGDVIYAQVTKIDQTTVSFTIINLTKLIIFPFWFLFAEQPIQPPLSPTNPIPARVEGHTAEWIVERPRPPGKDHGAFFDLANYQQVNFDICLAGTEAGVELDLSRAGLQQMVDWQPAPPGSRALSTPDTSSLSHSHIRVRYGQ